VLLNLPERSIKLTWDVPVTESSVTYKVFRSTSFIASIDGLSPLNTDVTNTFLIDSPLQDATYFYLVAALDGVGNESAASNQVSALFDVTGPGAITDLRISSVTAPGSLTLSWTAPEDNLTAVSRYILKSSSSPISESNFDGAQTIPNSLVPLSPGSTETFNVSVSTSQTNYLAIKSSDSSGNLSGISNNAVQDNIAPEILSIDLAEGAIVSRPRNVTVQATDDVGISEIQFLADGAALSTIISGPFVFRWDTRDFDDGDHTLEVVARDQAGNESRLARSVTLIYAPPPAPVILSPSEGFFRQGPHHQRFRNRRSRYLPADAGQRPGRCRCTRRFRFMGNYSHDRSFRRGTCFNRHRF